MSTSVATSARAPVYHPIAGVNVRALPLLPEQAFVLSRVDGHTSAAAIAQATGIPMPDVLAHLMRLEELGAVRGPGAAPPPARSATRPSSTQRPPAPPASSSDAPTKPPPPGALNNALSGAPTKPPPALSGPRHPGVDESLSLSVELQTRILDLTERLADLNHFELLGIQRSADRAAVKRAYFSMIGTFHPDTYFGKKLGAFTKRIEKVFQRMTEAHDILSNAHSRAEYESYLGAVVLTRELEEVSDAPPSMEDLERLMEQAEQQARKSPPPAPATPAPAPAPSLAPARPVSIRPTMQPARQAPPMPRLPPPLPAAPPPLPAGGRAASLRPVQLVDDPAARRQALARKLGLAPVPAPAPGPPDDVRVRAEAARQSAVARELHQRYEHRKTSIRDHRLQRFMQVAEEAVAAGNAVSAMNSLKIARGLVNGDGEAEARIDELEKQLGGTISESYLQRARHEESNGQHAEAARSYTRAARGSPSADVLRSAAECYLKAGTELRLASELAREAVQMAPDRTDLRLSLAKIYEAAGMPQSAVRELERALALTPGSDKIKQWLKRLERAGV
ncbi:MAG: molecular chaperone DnaJ [Pseudomonadota bacterium]|jgi:tetratricopeptide (TPR) repeat protein